MKTNYFKIVIHIIAILFAISSSFVTHASEKTIPPEIGYFLPLVSPSASPCSFVTQCGTPSPVLCTAIFQGQTYQVYGKINPNDTFCQLTRYQKE